MRHLAATLSLALSLSLVTAAAAQNQPESKTAAPPEIKLPPGWTMADMQACIVAATPGKMHEEMLNEVGTWQGKQTMWMGPDTQPITSEVTSNCTSLLDGRYLQVEVKGDIPGMGKYNGLGVYGYDNVSQQFVATWIDNHSTGIMNGTGKLSADGKTLTWTYTHMCPITKKPTTMREIETNDGSGKKRIEMFGADPKSGKEFKMMVLELTKK